MLNAFPCDGAHVIVLQDAAAGALDAHNEATGGIGADDAGVGFHPVGGMVAALFGGEEGNGGLQGIEAEVGAIGQRNFAAAHVKLSPDGHIAGAVTLNFFYHDGQVIEFKFIFT